MQGVTVKKKSPSILLAVNLISPDGRYDDLYLSNYATIQIKDELLRIDGVGDITYLGQRDYSLRIWLDPDKMAAMNLSTERRGPGRPESERPSRRRADRPATDAARPVVPVDDEHPGTARRRRAVQEHHLEDRRGRPREKGHASNAVVRLRDVARVELGAQQYDQICHLDGQPSVGLAVFQLPGSNALRGRRADQEEDGGAEAELPRRIGIQDRLRHDAVRQAVDRGSLQDPVRGRDPGGHRRAVLPAGLEGDDPADDRRAGLAGRHVRRHGGCWASA